MPCYTTTTSIVFSLVRFCERRCLCWALLFPNVQLVVLVSRVSSDPRMKANQDRLIQMLQGRGYELEFIDGADREVKDLRNR